MNEDKDKKIQELEKIIEKQLHRIISFEEERSGKRYFDVEYNNHSDSDHWISWGVSSPDIEYVENILDFVNKRLIDNDNSFFKTVKYFRIVEKFRGINKVIKIIKNNYFSIPFEEYLKTNKPEPRILLSVNENVA